MRGQGHGGSRRKRREGGREASVDAITLLKASRQERASEGAPHEHHIIRDFDTNFDLVSPSPRQESRLPQKITAEFGETMGPRLRDPASRMALPTGVSSRNLGLSTFEKERASERVE